MSAGGACPDRTGAELVRLLRELIREEVRRAEAERQEVPEPRPGKLTVQEAAAVLGVKPRTMYAYVERGILKPVRTGPKGGKLMFKREDVERLASG